MVMVGTSDANGGQDVTPRGGEPGWVHVIDDKTTPEQSQDIKKLDLVTPGSTLTLRDRGMHSAQRALGDDKFAAFRDHIAAPAQFFHGPNKNV